MDGIDTYIEDFLTHVRIEKNYSEATTDTYRISLTIFSRFLLEANSSITDKKCILCFINHLQEKGNGDVTIAHRLAALKSFFSYLGKKKGSAKKDCPQSKNTKQQRRSFPYRPTKK